MNEVDCVVIGAGVIGLAVGRAFALTGREVVVLERAPHFGMETSSRNSEVIHAGIYYTPGSLKAESCVAGRERVYRYCAERGIRHRRCGKYIVAVDESEIPALEKLQSNALRCGVDDLEFLDSAYARREEPQLACAAVLHSPSTGIIDSHEYMLALLADIEARGGDVICQTEVDSIEPTACDTRIYIGGGSQPAVRCNFVINAAGLDSARIAQRIVDFPSIHVPHLYYAKGNYFALSGRAPFRRLVYPVPDVGGLGVHMTVDLAGRARFGPDVEWVDDSNYAVDEGRADRFYAAIRRYWPALQDGTLHAAYAGIRPKLSGPGEPPVDFAISGPAQHGVPGIVNLFGIESPGLTASLDLADRVVRAALTAVSVSTD